MAKGDLGYSLCVECINSLWRCSLLVVSVAQLTKVIVAPGEKGPLSCQDDSDACLRNLEVEDVELVHALHSVRRIEFAEDALAPDEQLLIC